MLLSFIQLQCVAVLVLLSAGRGGACEFSVVDQAVDCFGFSDDHGKLKLQGVQLVDQSGGECRVVSCRVVSCRVVSCRVVSCRVVSCRVVSCRVVSCRVVSCSSVGDRAVQNVISRTHSLTNSLTQFFIFFLLCVQSLCSLGEYQRMECNGFRTV
jgi:hypothetical protein